MPAVATALPLKKYENQNLADYKLNSSSVADLVLDSGHGSSFKSVNLRYITVGWLDDDMIVPPSDGPMFILINWE